MKKNILIFVVFFSLILLSSALFIINTKTVQESIIIQEDIIYEQDYKSQPFEIGRELFTVSSPQYVCGTQGKIILNDLTNSCFKTNVLFNGKNYQMYSGDEIIIDEILKVRLVTSAKVFDGSYKHPYDWKNTFYFTFINTDFIKISTSEIKYFYNFNTENKLILYIDNSFIDFDGGIETISYTDTLSTYKKNDIKTSFYKGQNTANVIMNTDSLMRNKLSVKSYILINNKKYYSDQIFTFNYEVVPNVDEKKSTSTKCTFTANCPDNFECKMIENTQMLCVISDKIETNYSGFIKNNMVSVIFFTLILINVGVLIWLKKRK